MKSYGVCGLNFRQGTEERLMAMRVFPKSMNGENTLKYPLCFQRPFSGSSGCCWGPGAPQEPLMEGGCIVGSEISSAALTSLILIVSQRLCFPALARDVPTQEECLPIQLVPLLARSDVTLLILNLRSFSSLPAPQITQVITYY